MSSSFGPLKNFVGGFVHYLDEWSTEEFPDVIIDYTFIAGDKSVGEVDHFEVSVIRDKRDIWDYLTIAEQKEVEQYCMVDMKKSIKEWNEP